MAAVPPTGLTASIYKPLSNGAIIHVSISNYGTPSSETGRYIEGGILDLSCTQYYDNPRMYNVMYNELEGYIQVSEDAPSVRRSRDLKIISNSNYKYGAYATNTEANDMLVADTTFTTNFLAPKVVLTSVTDTSATFQYIVLGDGGVLSKQLEYSTNGGRTWDTILSIPAGDGSARFGTFTLDNLTPNTQYTIKFRNFHDMLYFATAPDITFNTRYELGGTGIIWARVGETLVLGGDSMYHLTSISGLESPAIRMGDGLYAARDGGFVSGHFYGHRTITINGFYLGRDCEENADLRRNLFGLLKIRYNTPVVFNMPNGEYYTMGYIADVKSDLESPKAGEFQITINCPDPIIYKSNAGTPIYEQLELTSNATTVVNNDGDVFAYPVIRVLGQIDGLEISNETTEQTMQLDITTTSESDELVIDMKNRLITLNGQSASQYRTSNSVWWWLARERNDIKVKTSGTGIFIIEYQEGYAGI